MTETLVCENFRFRLIQLLPLVQGREAQIVSGIAQRMAPLPDGDSPDRREAVAGSLVALLIKCASNLAAFGAPGDVSEEASRHRSLGIDGRDYSRFGLILTPVLREVIQTPLPPPLLAAWCDAFWMIVRELNSVRA